MTKRTPVTLAVLALAASLAACGPGGGNGGKDGGTDGGTPDDAYFGLTVGTCYRLVGGPSNAEQMTIGVETRNKALGYEASEIMYRLGGLLRRTDWVTFKNGQVLIHRREDRGTPTVSVEFDPPIVFLERPERDTGTSPIVTDTTATDVNTSATSSWHVEVALTPVEATTVPQQTAPYQAFPVFDTYSHPSVGPDQQDRLWVVPDKGIVRADLDGTSWPDMKLDAVWQMKQGDTTCTTGP